MFADSLNVKWIFGVTIQDVNSLKSELINCQPHIDQLTELLTNSRVFMLMLMLIVDVNCDVNC